MDDINGYLKVNVYTAQDAIPLKNATVSIYKGTPPKDLITQLYTNDDGSTQSIILPTLSKPLSLEPSDIKPYLGYDIRIEYPGYQTQYFVNVPIFEGIVSLQSVQMLPLNNESINYEYTFESENL